MSGRVIDSEADGEAAVTLAVSPEQLAAVLDGETLQPGATLGNRLIGGLRLLGCAGEAGLASGLALVPEPTLLTKAASVGVGLHAADQCTTGGRQLWTGRDERSLTERASSGLARRLGANPATAETIGLATDFMVPIGGAALAGAVRVAAVNSGRLSLRQHEARAWAKGGPGGHTIRLHIGQSETALRQRIAETAGPTGRPRFISSFSTFQVAETEISRVLQVNRSAIEAWSRTARQGISRSFELDAGQILGHGVVREGGEYMAMSRLRVVIKKESFRGMPHYILTAYPIL
ncbi:RNase A-like domain-containing protein [Aureimonas jatrophae]|uniref:Bacterial CdiA-CT RNAse A domain-containing protein n=1 Tax=Aureimonas jatrophae TaxID=1166073 RepID=A0A1H0N4H3_9HYPH|nr:RNase A-like domain-containing protein [Aureimonas jatrophae]MBB3953031.1 hypothetical protein [Aureimonas jatrophae]SDO87511.1 hypothetical protein SAMN05192530_11723 [Aureimonas jatrophae]